MFDAVALYLKFGTLLHLVARIQSVFGLYGLTVSLCVCLQDIDYARLRPVRYQRLGRKISGLCVSGSWLIVTDDRITTSLYSLPDMQLHDQLHIESCLLPRADGDGVVYVPGSRYIAVLQIIDSGHITEIRNITAVGGQSLYFPAIAVGPQPGQLCVGRYAPPTLWVINISDGSLLHNLVLPDQCEQLSSIAALASGHLMISYKVSSTTHGLAVYRSVTDSPTLLANLTTVEDWVNGCLGSGNHFLASYTYDSDLLVLGPDGSVLYTVDAIRGKQGVFLSWIQDVAVWQDCVWLGGYYGDFVLLCAD